MMMKQIFSVLVVCLVTFQFATAQSEVKVRPAADQISGKEIEVRKSPMAASYLLKGETYIKVVYNQPHLRGRKMLGGEAVPYGQIWRFGANESTEIFLNQTVTIAGNKLKKGAYSIYCIPTADKWTMIFSKQLGQLGPGAYDQKQDVFRADVPVKKADKPYEAFVIWFSNDATAMNVAWGDAMVSVPIQVK